MQRGSAPGARLPGIWGLTVGEPWPSHQETQLKPTSASTWLRDLGQATPKLEASKSSSLIMIPHAL